MNLAFGSCIRSPTLLTHPIEGKFLLLIVRIQLTQDTFVMKRRQLFEMKFVFLMDKTFR